MTNPSNSVSSRWLQGMTDAEIKAQCAEIKDEFIRRAFPGKVVNATSLEKALQEAGANFTVGKRPICTDVRKDEKTGDVVFREIGTHVATFREDTGETLGVVGKDYGVVNFGDAFAAIDILAQRGDALIRNVELIDAGRKCRVTALLGTTVMPSQGGAPNTLAHFVIFEAGHDGRTSVTANLFSLRLECFNGMTSRKHIEAHRVAHSSRASKRMEQVTEAILTDLIGDVATEMALFQAMARKRMTRKQFSSFVDDLLGPLDEEAAQATKTRRENTVKELEGYFNGGNEGAGQTAWGAYNSVTRWLKAQEERYEDAAKMAKKFHSNLQGDGNRKAARALALLTR